ncbi:MMPL family transporter [Streptomyces bohaiensis]|uniref:MMPL family transporter n=1 Tax=Streptomyces bohaiensis TaxID=1431344 RepID=A0ABX1CAM8_9ACTN|nr:MMPL family transporter [Streptomyces bohaiensis]NJQ14442.1 MMPL family transporter [Streptomyces bohaiensis]
MKASLLYRFGQRCARRAWWTVGVWALVLAVVGGLAAAYGGETSDDISVPGSEAERAAELLGEHFPGLDGATAVIVLHAQDEAEEGNSGGLTSGDRPAALAESLRAASEVVGVTMISDPSQDEARVSQDGNTAFADVFFEGGVGEVGAAGISDLSEALEPARDAGVSAYVGGELAFATSGAETGGAEAVGLLVAVVLLLFVFGSAAAAGLPILIALCSVGVVSAGLFLMAAVTEIPTEAPQVGVMIGLGVGIDYALLVVNRHREELRRGRSLEDAIGAAVATAGRSVVFAGFTVVIAVAGLYLVPLPAVRALATTCAVVVLVSVIAAVTLVPALLGLFGTKVLRRADRRAGVGGSTEKAAAAGGEVATGEGRDEEAASATRRRADDEDRALRQTFWGRWVNGVDRRPWPCLLLATGALLVLSIPVLSMELSMPDGRSTAQGSDARVSYELLASEFGPGVNGPVTVLVTHPGDGTEGEVLAATADVLGNDERIEFVSDGMPAEDGRAHVLQAVPRAAPADPAVAELIEDLRAELDALESDGVAVLITGPTALYADLTSETAAATPLVVVVVVLLSSLLLLVVFRSVPVAAVAAVFNLLGIGAAFGVLVAVFQWGWGMQLLGLDETQAIASFVPVILFAVVFGLSMDYQVFLMARVREEYLRTGDTHTGLVHGATHTARVITAAALIMISVFLGFAFAEEPLLKMLGLGLAVAVALDATVVRMLLVPAAVSILGDRNWWMPAALDRLIPRVDPHGESVGRDAGAVTPAADDREVEGARAERA